MALNGGFIHQGKKIQASIDKQVTMPLLYPVYAVLACTSFGTCCKGLQRMKETLQNVLMVPSANMKTCHDLVTFKQGLDWLRDRLTNERCTVLTYFSGHGNQMSDASGDEVDGLDEYYIFDNGILLDDQLTSSLLGGTLKDPSNLVICISDCCSSGSALDEALPDANYRINHTNWVTLGATTDVEDAFIDGDGPVFTAVLTERLPLLVKEPLGKWPAVLTEAQRASWIGTLQNFTVRFGNEAVKSFTIDQ